MTNAGNEEQQATAMPEVANVAESNATVNSTDASHLPLSLSRNGHLSASLTGEGPISKRQQKKQLKKEYLKQAKISKKAAKKEKQKASAAVKRKEMDNKVQNMTAEEREAYRQKAHAVGQERIQSKARQKLKMKEAMLSGQHIIIDLDFSAEMTREQITSLCQQLAFCHSVNSAADTPVHLELTSMGGVVGKTLKAQLSGVDNWPVTLTEGAYLETFKEHKQDLVYLTADSQCTLTELDSKKAYIIGGLVDRNSHKGLCEGKAREQGISTAKLPIQDHVDLAGNKVLTVNQVFAMLVEWVGCKDWSQAVEKALPQRKIKKAKREDSLASDEGVEPEQKMQRTSEE